MSSGFEKSRRLDFISNESLSNNDRMGVRYLSKEKVHRGKICWETAAEI